MTAYTDTDAGGDPREVEGEVRDVVTESRARVLSANAAIPEQRERAWLASPHCAHCGEPTTLEECRFVPNPDPLATPRIAHLTKLDRDGRSCFVHALLAVNPTFKTPREPRGGEL